MNADNELLALLVGATHPIHRHVFKDALGAEDVRAHAAVDLSVEVLPLGLGVLIADRAFHV